MLTVTPEKLSGAIERHNEESGFCVLKVKVKGQRDLVTFLTIFIFRLVKCGCLSVYGSYGSRC